MRVAFIGLGRMGLPMAANVLRAGHRLTVYNRTASRADALAAEGAAVAATPAGAARGAEVLVTMLADDSAVESVLFGDDGATAPEGAFGALPRGAAHVSMSTIGVALSRRLAARHAAAGHDYLAAPVFGRPEAAEAGRLRPVVAGPAAVVARCRPVLEAVGREVFVLGEDPGLANTVKLAGNFVLASAIEALGEAIALVRKSGGEASAFMEVMNALFASPVYASYGGLIVEERYEPAGFAFRLGLKDLLLALAAGGAEEVPLPLASVLRDHFLTGVAGGLGDADWAALGRLAAGRAGLGPS